MQGIYVRIPDEGYKRSPELQKKLYNKIPAVTWVLCPFSSHCHGLAIDLAVLKKIGDTTYEIMKGKKMEEQYETMARISMGLGIDWGFKLWGTDKPHFQMTGGLNITDIVKGKTPSTPSFIPVVLPKILERARQRLRKRGIEC